MNIGTGSKNQKQRLEEKVKEIILDNDRCDVQNNFYSPHLNSSLKVAYLLDLAKKESKTLILEGDAEIYFGTKDKFSHLNTDVISSRIFVDSSLSKATQDLSDEILSQFKANHGPVEYELRQLYIEGIELIEINQNSIVIKLCCGT